MALAYWIVPRDAGRIINTRTMDVAASPHRNEPVVSKDNNPFDKSDSKGANPYRSPEVDQGYPEPKDPRAPGLAEPFHGMQYMEMFTFVTNSPTWFNTLLFGMLCQFIPIVGPIVLLGYQFAVVEKLHLTGGRSYPEFDFGKFADYLNQGVWPFLVGLVVIFPMMILIYLSMIVFMLAGAAIAQQNEAAGVIFMMIMIPIGVVLSMVFSFFLVPMYLRAGLTQSFGEGFQFDYILAFVKNTWKELLLGFLFLWVGAIALTFVGLLLFCVGVFFFAVWTNLALSHLYFQAYQLHLSRGGKPIPIASLTNKPS